MSKNIKGVTIEIDGDVSGLTQALKKVDNETKSVQKELKQVDSLLKFDPSNVELLSQKQKLLGDAIDSTSTRLDALKQAQSEVERQFQSGEIGEEAYRKFQREIIATEGKLKSFQSQADKVQVKIDAQTDVSGLEKMTKKLEEVGTKAKEVGDKMKDVGSEMTTKVTAPIAAFGTGALLAAAQFDNAAGQIQSALGVTAEEAEALEDKATSVWKAGFGESLEEVTDGLIRVKQNMKEIDGNEIEGVTKNALALAKTFDSDVNEVTRAANNLMTNFGVDADKAFDMMAKGAQNGLNFSNELFDNLAEYAPLWSDMGYSAEEMFGILEAGAEAGVYNLDYLNDVMKEFQIRATDGSKSTTEAVSALGPEAEKVWEAFSKGEATVADMTQVAVAELSKIDDKVKQNELGVALFGTKWEDLGGDVVLSMLEVGQSLEDFEGAMNGVAEAQEKTFGQRWDNLTRTAAVSLEPVGKVLLDFAEQWLPKIISLIESLANWFSNLSPVIQVVMVAFGALVAALGPVILIAGNIISVIGSLTPLFTTVFTTIAGVISGPVVAIVAAIAAIIAIGVALYQNWEEVSTFLSTVWEGIESVATTVFQAIVDFITGAWQSIENVTSQVWNTLTDYLSNLWDGILNILTTVWDAIKLAAETIWDAIQLYFETVLGIYTTIFTTAWDAIKSAVTTVWDTLKTTATMIFDTISKYFTDVWETIKTTFTNATTNIFNTIKTKFTEIQTNIQNIMNAVKKFLSDTWDAIKNAITTVVTNIFNTIKDKFNEIKTTITNIMNEVKKFLSDTWETIKTSVTTIVTNIYNSIKDKFDEMKTAITDKMGEIKTTIFNIWEEVTTFFSNIDLYDIGVSIMTGLFNGITSMATSLFNKAAEIANSVKDTIAGALDINSPSRVMIGFGKNIGEGLEMGMDSMVNRVAASSMRLADAVSSVQASMASSANASRAITAATYNTSSLSTDNSRNFNPTIHITTVEDPTRAAERMLKRLAYQL